ncbi:MAG: fumarate hydratase [Elusimicrobia bacterium CG06_land_8_20_14_3_00_38_11]|nr:MAG: fumarate hydratase [Elusimicrobia bacterium CG06_land_8_20_14_3_00_38_11]
MRRISVLKISEIVETLLLDVNFSISHDVLRKIKIACNKEKNRRAKMIFEQILKNSHIARREKIPLCQDTGTAVVFLEIGQDIQIVGGNLTDAVNEGVRRAYKKGYLRNSIVADPLERKNTGDNTPASIHADIVPGNKLKISVIVKGGGAENMSALKMFAPSAAVKDIKNFIVETVISAGANACPPFVVGVGLGGTFETVGLLAKKSFLRELDSKNPKKIYQKLEEEILADINKTGLGPMALGGRTTALAVLIETAPTHITSFPVAVNIQCHAFRKKSVVL